MINHQYNRRRQATVIKDIIEQAHQIYEVSGGNPRIHPNGFIQLDLDPVADSWHDSHQKGHSGAKRRLHIWNPPGIELPHQGTVNEVHDHVFDMHSNVIKGTLWQCLYIFDLEGDAEIAEPTHQKYQAVYAKSSDSRLEPTGEKGWLRQTHRFPITALSGYEQPAFTLHDSEPEGCVVTVMSKTAVYDGEATVICPIDTPPDNSFDRASAMPIYKIWDAIFAAIEEPTTVPKPTPYG
jgi:hypothetical protein